MDSIIKVKDLTIYYGNNNRALHNVNIEIEKNDFVGIIGQNGSGKSTLLKAILGIIPITGGTVYFNNIPGRKGIKKLNIGYVPQHSQMNSGFPINVLDAVALGMLGKGLHPFNFVSDNQRKKALEMLEMVKIDHLKDRQISELSGGEFQRLLFARALAIDPDILVLDEPTASIDANSRELIYSLLNKFKEENKMTILLVTHDLEEIVTLADKLLCLNNRVVYYGDANITIDDINNYFKK